MCDRSKVEVLARELCIEYWRGKRDHSDEPLDLRFENVRDYTEQNWKKWEGHALSLVQTLEEHN